MTALDAAVAFVRPDAAGPGKAEGPAIRVLVIRGGRIVSRFELQLHLARPPLTTGDQRVPFRIEEGQLEAKVLALLVVFGAGVSPQHQQRFVRVGVVELPAGDRVLAVLVRHLPHRDARVLRHEIDNGILGIETLYHQTK